MKFIRHIGSSAFVIGLFTVIFIGIPWHIMTANDPVIPIWLRIALFFILGGVGLVLLTLALDMGGSKGIDEHSIPGVSKGEVILLTSTLVPNRDISEILGLVQGHTVFAIWLGKDLSAIIRLVLGGELTEYSEMMGRARMLATNRMIARATELGADAVVNIRYMTTSVVGSAAELLVYGTAVKLDK